MTEKRLGDCVGWNMWNMSVRISAATMYGRVSREHLDLARASGRWDDDYLNELERLTLALEEVASRAQLTWATLRQIKEAAPRPFDNYSAETMAQINAAFHEGDVTVYYEMKKEYERLVVGAGDSVPW